VAPSTIGSSHALLAGVRAGFTVNANFAWRDHPIGVPYPSDRQDYNPQSSLAGRGVPLPDGRVECISCHDPHDRTGHDHMLVISNRGSALCRSCHRK
jgi:predicted CXXCH cytochrome family protein